jgi:urea carboxylase
MAAGRGDVDIAEGEFSLAAYTDFLAADADGIAAFRQQQSVAFNAERSAWDRAGEVQRAS